MNITIAANDKFSYTLGTNTEFEPLFLNPDGTRKRFPIGWNGKGRYLAGSLIIWLNGVALTPGSDYVEEGNGIFFDFLVAPDASYKYTDFMVSYQVRLNDLAFSEGTGDYAGEEYFLFPNWNGAKGVDDAFWVGKYQAARSDATATAAGSSNTPVSKKGIVPWCNITPTDSHSVVASKGGNFHLLRNREWASIALWCREMDVYPAGNSASGSDGMGVAGTADPTESGRCLTGTGPVTWNHNLRVGGIADLCGNVWEWLDGLQLIDGVINVYNDNNSALISTGLGIAINPGQYAGYLMTDSAVKDEAIITTTNTRMSFRGADGGWYNSSGTRGLIRGGNWLDGAFCGVFAFSVGSGLSGQLADVGFRVAAGIQ